MEMNEGDYLSYHWPILSLAAGLILSFAFSIGYYSGAQNLLRVAAQSKREAVGGIK